MIIPGQSASETVRKWQVDDERLDAWEYLLILMVTASRLSDEGLSERAMACDKTHLPRSRLQRFSERLRSRWPEI